ncbi:MAG TPA: hypothetical protein VIX20_05100, partial [Ktedonobacteraceae bacterium]
MKISHLQDSFAHIVGKMRDSLLFERDDAGPEIIAIVRLRPRKGRALYFDALVRLFFAIFAMLMATFAGLTLFVSTAVVILSFFSWIPIAQLDEMLQRPAPQDLLLFFAIPQDTLNRLEIFFELESALALILIVGALLLLIKEVGNFRWLLILSRQFASQIPPEPIRKMMRISTPSSVDYEIIEEPSLTM